MWQMINYFGTKTKKQKQKQTLIKCTIKHSSVDARSVEPGMCVCIYM